VESEDDDDDDEEREEAQDELGVESEDDDDAMEVTPVATRGSPGMRDVEMIAT